MSYDPRFERPAAEPEIIPPDGASRPRWPKGGQPRLRVFMAGADPSGRLRVKRPGPFTIAAVLLGLGLFLGFVLFVALGALLLVLPVLAVALSAAIAFGVLRRSFRRGSRRNYPVRPGAPQARY